jgi:hypothetical protein
MPTLSPLAPSASLPPSQPPSQPASPPVAPPLASSWTAPPSFHDIHAIARRRIAWAQGEHHVDDVMAPILAEMGVERLASPSDLRAFGLRLMQRGAPVGWLGAMLVVLANRIGESVS